MSDSGTLCAVIQGWIVATTDTDLTRVLYMLPNRTFYTPERKNAKVFLTEQEAENASKDNDWLENVIVRTGYPLVEQKP